MYITIQQIYYLGDFCFVMQYVKLKQKYFDRNITTFMKTNFIPIKYGFFVKSFIPLKMISFLDKLKLYRLVFKRLNHFIPTKWV